MLAVNTVLKELDVSANTSYQCDSVGFAQELAVGISDNGTLSKLDASDNHMFGKKDKAGITAWADALKANTSITELNLTKNKISANDTKILAPAISDNGALLVLSLKGNNLFAAGCKALAEGLKGNQVITELNIASNSLGWNGVGADMSGVIALADIIPDMGALAKLDMSTNVIGAEQEKDLQRICMAGGIELTQ